MKNQLKQKQKNHLIVYQKLKLLIHLLIKRNLVRNLPIDLVIHLHLFMKLVVFHVKLIIMVLEL